MYLSSRILNSNESVTLKVNEKIEALISSGKEVYNLTSGQLPFKPSSEFISQIKLQLNFLKSFQYSPNSGFEKLCEKMIQTTEGERDINLTGIGHKAIVSNGSKHSLFNALGTLINPGDEVIILTPYWVSYPEMVKFWGGIPKVVESHTFDNFTPAIDEILLSISPMTKAIIINSPNNPAGIHYDDNWMKEFATKIKDHKDVMIISDEIYSKICYFDPKPTYFYQHCPELLSRTLIINGISKSFASTGLRIGTCIGNEKVINAMTKLQSQTTSGPSSLIQRALLEFDFSLLDNYFSNVEHQLRECSRLLMDRFREHQLAHCWYQTSSAFYYFLDFSRFPFFDKKFDKNDDHSDEIVEEILEKAGVALVPGTAFGQKNTARMSLTLEAEPFSHAVDKLLDYLIQG